AHSHVPLEGIWSQTVGGVFKRFITLEPRLRTKQTKVQSTMTFFKVLLCAALILQAVCGDSSSRETTAMIVRVRTSPTSSTPESRKLSGSGGRLMDNPPEGGPSTTLESGQVTVDDGSQWLVHKGDRYGLSSQTVVTDARHMSPAWRVSEQQTC
ncbi:hypothetical protein XENOCAPTIV_007643, partial [Xenoophorus captivus]